MSREAGSTIAPGAARFARHVDMAIVAIGALMLAAYLAASVVLAKPGGRVVFGDATHHFVQLRSAVFDRDLDFRNEYFRIYGLRGDEPGTEWITTDLTSTGHVRNYMPVGPALLWAPLYLAVTGGERMLSAAGIGSRPDGFSRADQTVPGVTGILASTLAAWICWRLTRRYTTDRTAAMATIAVWLGSHAIYYSLVSPSYSHAASMLAASLFVSRWLSTRRQPSSRHFAELGALAGLAALMRWQDALLLVLPLFDAVTRPASWRDRALGAAAAGSAWLVAFSPQMIVWNVLYGQPLAMPQGPSFLRWTDPHPFDVLFSTNHGLFTWAPLLLFATVGLALFLARRRDLRLPVALVLLFSWYINAAVADWWAGEAYGARRFLSLFPFFVLGLAAWIDTPGWLVRSRAARLGVVAILVAANWFLLLQYELFMKGLEVVAPYPAGTIDMWLTRFAVPWRLFMWWRQ
ncbi:MAG: hypothetical protein ABI652_06785 [Acidobacteriota bacterium]